jgi:pimeloyl-ACP methyl ester carboxylesterase
MSVAVFHFGFPNRQLLGTLHYRPRLRQRGAAVLICNPMGEEAARAHRVYRVLASQLERAGYAAQRFDYFGTGDSDGDALEATIAAWGEDIETAAKELTRRTGVHRLVLVGVRLGASLAVMAAARLNARHLILWDPVVNGASYLQELAAAHREFMHEELGAVWNDDLHLRASGATAEVLGTPISPELRNGLAGIDLTSIPLRADHTTVICSSASPHMVQLHEHWLSAPTMRWIDMPVSESWNSDKALNSATVPIDVIQTIVARIEELSP